VVKTAKARHETLLAKARLETTPTVSKKMNSPSGFRPPMSVKTITYRNDEKYSREYD